MGRVILFIISFLLCASLLSAWDGGYARLQALGGVEYALEDRTNEDGLYDAGYGAVALLSAPASFITLTPMVSFSSWGDPDGLWYDQKSIDAFLENANLINLRLTENDNVIMKPLYFNSFIINNGAPFGVTDRIAGVEVQYARRINGQAGAGATVRYSYMMEQSNNLKVISDRLEYLLDAYYNDNEGLTAVLQGGFMGGLFENRTYNENYYSFDGSYDPFDYSLTGYSGKLENSFMDIEVKNSHVRLGAGLAYEIKGTVKVSISGGAFINAVMESTWTNHYFGTTTTSMDSGLGYFADTGIRVYLPLNMIFSSSARGKRIDFTGSDDSLTFPGQTRSKYNGAFTAGLAYDAGALKIPVEYYMTVNDKTETNNFIRHGGIRGGAEYAFDGFFTLRAGADWPGLHDARQGVISVTEYALTGGAGFDFGGLKINLGCRYFTQKEKRSHAYFISDNFEMSITRLAADVTYLF